ncbi:hypothetical protein [Kitasatospora sp. NPDC091207]|uniref:hypothetical protein n=1 Tax=Kitasatospora sp. NPDC091207 TaxID=3364083 RepID=UPI003813AD20
MEAPPAAAPGRAGRLLALAVAVVTVVGGVIGWFAFYDSHRTTESGLRKDAAEHQDRQEDEANENGLPLLVSAGGAWYGPAWYADGSPDPSADGRAFPVNGGEIFEWLEARTPVGRTGTAVTVQSRHRTTVVVQGAELSGLSCQAPLSGAAFRPPGVGDGGDEAPPTGIGFNLDAQKPIAHNVETAAGPGGSPQEVLGGPFTHNVALDKGDARQIVVMFESRTKSCTFRADLLVSSKGRLFRIPLPATWKAGAADGYVFKVTAPAERYRQTLVTDNAWTLRSVAPQDVAADGLALTLKGESSAGPAQ